MRELLIDKDGTLINPKSGSRFVRSPWDQEPIPGAKEAIALYTSKGYTPIIISNQAGVAAGRKSLGDCIQEMRFCLELFPEIQESYFCPDFEGLECWRVWGNCSEQHRICYTPNHSQVIKLEIEGRFRKPNAGMLKLAIDIHVPDEVIYVGDRPEDEGAALAANAPFVWADKWRRSPRLAAKRCGNSK